MKFTAEQLRAIGHQSGNLQIIACAGSGKTEVVAQRVANLLKGGAAARLAPRNIVAFTFTDRAAAELEKPNFSSVSRSARQRPGYGGNVCGHHPLVLFGASDDRSS